MGAWPWWAGIGAGPHAEGWSHRCRTVDIKKVQDPEESQPVGTNNLTGFTINAVPQEREGISWKDPGTEQRRQIKASIREADKYSNNPNKPKIYQTKGFSSPETVFNYLQRELRADVKGE